ncbi:MAG TPA: amidohydrolase family protein [Solirubrobacteraceae bacterium]|nr:amidohydrolase family protein [Solirubrobacteraceae bacterium]
MDLESLIAPWAAQVREAVPGVRLFDTHTHLGSNDPDGMKQTPAELLRVLDEADAAGAFTFPMHEPDGYRAANDMVIDAAAHSDGRLVCFCRVSPNSGTAPDEARRALRSGARGIKLHPRAEQFGLDHPAVRELAAIAHERRLPILIHAGRGIPALGRHTVALAQEFSDARFILAHAGITDLAWIWRVAADLPNLLFDTSWFMGADLRALYSLVPPGQILFASDAPYGNPLLAAVSQIRLALSLGLSQEQIRCIMSEQSLRIAAGEPLAFVGPAVGERERATHVLLDRVAQFVMMGTILSIRAPDASPEMLALARMACDVPDEIDDAPVFAALRSLLDAHLELSRDGDDVRRARLPLMLAASVATTPDVPLPTGLCRR